VLLRPVLERAARAGWVTEKNGQRTENDAEPGQGETVDANAINVVIELAIEFT
jgi:hypothetical protein